MRLLRPLAALTVLAGALAHAAGRDTAPAGPAAARTDRYGDPLPEGAVARLGTVRLRHGWADITFSPDGKRLISSGGDGEIRWWDVATGKLVRRTRLTARGSGLLAPGGALAAVSDLTSVRVLDTSSGKERHKLPAEKFTAAQAFSPDGKWLALTTFGDPERIELWDVSRGKMRRALKAPEFQHTAEVVLAPGAKHVILISRDQDADRDDRCHYYMWDGTTGESISTKQDGECAAFSADGRTLAIGRYGEVKLLDAGTREEKKTLRAEAGLFDRLAFSPDGRFLAGAYGGGQEAFIFGPLLEKSGIILWDLKAPDSPRRLRWAGVRARLAFSPDGKTLACQSKRFGSAILLWDVASGRQLLRRPGHGTPVQALAVSPDGKLIASDADDALYVWNASTGEALHEMGGRGEENRVCFFSQDGRRLIASSRGGAVEVWDLATEKRLHRFQHLPPDKRFEGEIQAASLSADGKRLAAVWLAPYTPAQLIVWDLATGKELERRRYRVEVRGKEDDIHGPQTIAHAAFSPDGDVVSVWRTDRVGLEQVSTGRLLAALPQGAGGPLWFSPDGRMVAAALVPPGEHRYFAEMLRGVSLIETATGEEISRFETTPFKTLAFTPDSRSLAVADGHALRVWDTDSGELLQKRQWAERVRTLLADGAVRSLAMLADGKAVTGLEGGDILIWRPAPVASADKPARKLAAAQLDGLWADLATDARKAHLALHVLGDAPAQAVPFLRDHLHPLAPVDDRRVKQLLANLDDRRFAVREAASRKLAGLRERVEPTLRDALHRTRSEEARRRLRAILGGPPRLSADTRRALRATALLERLGTPEARRVLEKLGAGAPALETREAKAALARLEKRVAAPR